MAQTLYGDGGFRGLASEESDLGLFAASMSMNATEEEVQVLDAAGECVGLSLGNESSTISCNGVTIGAALGTIANTAIKGPTAVSKYFVTSVSLERANQGWETGSFEAKGYLNIT